MGVKVLIADDEIELLKLLTFRLNAFNYEVITASNGSEGLEKVKVEQPDLLILDILMPGMSGREMAESVRKLEGAVKNVPIIIITANPFMRDHFRTLDIHAFLTKPIDADALLKQVQAVIGISPHVAQKFPTPYSLEEEESK